jgi:NAD(P)-dependent dehydrogenase (short-subunit alcohol dehydrogenase family)
MATSTRPVVLVNDGSFYVGPNIARALAHKGFNLVVGDPTGELVDDLRGIGADVAVAEGVRDLARPESSLQLVDVALSTFGRVDSAAMFSGRIVTGRFLQSTIDDLHAVTGGCIDAPYNFLKAVLPPMVEAGVGQVLVITSASAARPTPGAPLYSAARAGATMLVKNVALEMARHHVQVNAVGTNFMDFPEFLKASGATDPEVRKKIEAQVPLGRLGTLDEFASFCMPYLDGTSRFATGQFVAFAGGWA